MTPDNVDNTKGETPMTDLQFTAYIELRDKYEALLQETVELRLVSPCRTEDAMSEQQFERYVELRDKYDEQGSELVSLRKENTRLKMQLEMIKSGLRVSKF